MSALQNLLSGFAPRIPANETYAAFVNGSFAGYLSEADRLAVERETLKIPRVYLAQLLNALKVAGLALRPIVTGLPILVFWGLMALAYIEPLGYEAVLALLQMGPLAVQGLLANYGIVLLGLWVSVPVIQGAWRGRVPGFRNEFQRAAHRGWCQRLEVPNGDVDLRRESVRH